MGILTAHHGSLFLLLNARIVNPIFAGDMPSDESPASMVVYSTRDWAGHGAA
jgi:hypothetical protein